MTTPPFYATVKLRVCYHCLRPIKWHGITSDESEVGLLSERNYPVEVHGGGVYEKHGLRISGTFPQRC
jgi:hypothetical protein